MRQGYAPCVRCMKKYLNAALTSPLAQLMPESRCQPLEQLV